METIPTIMLSKRVQERVFLFIQDPSHGWLSVPKRLLFNVCTDDEIKKISKYSYTKGKSVYLEEDCDAGIFIDAWRRKYVNFHYEFSTSDKPSPVRSYERVESRELLEEKYFI